MPAQATTHAENPDRIFLDWLVLFSGIVVGSVILITAEQNLAQKIVAMVVLAVAAGMAVRFDFIHPFVWFGTTFTIYSISGPLLLHLDVHPYEFWGGYRIDTLDFNGAMDYQFLALAVALLVIGPRRVSFAVSIRSPNIAILYDGAFLVLAAAAFVGFANVLQIVSQGFSTKGDVVLSGDWTTRLSFAFNIAATALGVYLARLFSEGRAALAYLTLFLVVLAGVGVVLMIGQRHFLFRAGLISLVVYHIFHRRISGRYLLLLAVLALIASTMLGGYKMALVVRDVFPGESVSLWEENRTLFALRNPEFLNQSEFMQYLKVGLVAALGSEAMTPGNNLAMILSRVPQDLPYFFGETIPSDLLRSVLPGFIVAPLVDNTAVTYNRFVFPDTAESGGGVGFTIAGYGYLHFGIGGLALIMALIGLLLRGSYRWAAHSPFGLMFFIGFFPVAIYVARNDISGPLSQGLKHVIVPLLAMMVVAYLKGDRFVPQPGRDAAD